ncbi:MAG: hypothetical protein IGR92_05030 [Leptolyngbyaceae cyanobacterium T60_A2020_046]|nr:hypothetical protein [Leptolyngbyaceae cyanobacterium T60_A2020_046]
MSHTYEAFVDIKEYDESPSSSPRVYTERYEVDAMSASDADRVALSKAENIHPKAAEFGIRVTRLIH